MTPGARSFPAMGGTATVIVDGPAAAVSDAQRRIADLEAKWSRFRHDSEVSVLNAARRAPRRVSADTRLLLRCAKTAWERTEGSFDPTVLDALVNWGYDRDLATIERPCTPTGDRPAPGMATVAIDDAAGIVDLGGAGFDPGGIGKGLAADLVATELVAAGADAALVSVAGDLRVAGHPPGGGWVVGLEDALRPAADLVRLQLSGGGVATSSDRRRRWTTARGIEAHHILDPSTGAPARTALVGVSVLAGESWWAEALTKAVLVGGLSISGLASAGASAIGRSRTGEIVGTADLLEMARSAA